MLEFLNRLVVEETGAKSISYAVVVALIALATAASVSTSGSTIGDLWKSLSITINRLTTRA